MKSLWNASEALKCQDDLDLRVYTSRLLGANSDLVLHGGGNTSVKASVPNIFGESDAILYVKGSGWDLATIERPGFAPVKMGMLLKLAELETLSDSDMVNYQRSAMIDPNAPNPSIEAILHAIIPYKFVDHTHADAVIAVTNTPNSEARIKEIYGDRALIVPYVMPGFILAKEIQKQMQGVDLSKIDAMVLMHHGVFTFDDDAKAAYEKMIEAVGKAEDYIASRHTKTYQTSTVNISAMELARVRKAVSEVKGSAMVTKVDESTLSCAFAKEPEVARLATTGPLTPDHVIRTKKDGALIDTPDDIQNYAKAYRDYFEHNDDGSLTMLDPAPRWGVLKGRATVAFGTSAKEAAIVHDIKAHTLKSVYHAEAIEKYIALPEDEIFKMEYWELEQAKLKKAKSAPEFQGKIAVVTGGASGIGKACVERFAAAGACVAALDINPAVETLFDGKQIIGIRCDLTNEAEVKAAVERTVMTFGGIDVLVNNAGIFPESANIEEIDAVTWQKSLDINLTAQQKITTHCIPYLKEGIDPAVVFIVSKNVPSPGKGASCYSVAKAGANQLARIAALELAPTIRVNMLHPDAVFDTGIWSDEVIAKRAEKYGLSVEEYKTRNLLKTTITSYDVADLAVAAASALFAQVTGAQIAVDGGSDRII